MLTIAIIERHPIMQLGLKLELDIHFKNPRIYVTRDFQEYQNLRKEVIPNIFILGFHLNSIDNYKLKIEKCKALYPSVPLIVYGDYLRSKTISELVKLGINGYVWKKSEGVNLIRCIKAVRNGSIFINKNLMHESTDHSLLKGVLTTKQLIVALLLIQGFSNAQICEKLNLKPSTVSTYKNSIFTRMNVTNVIDLKEAMECLM